MSAVLISILPRNGSKKLRTVPADSRNFASLGSFGMCSDRFVSRMARLKPISLAGSWIRKNIDS